MMERFQPLDPLVHRIGLVDRQGRFEIGLKHIFRRRKNIANQVFRQHNAIIDRPIDPQNHSRRHTDNQSKGDTGNNQGAKTIEPIFK